MHFYRNFGNIRKKTHIIVFEFLKKSNKNAYMFSDFLKNSINTFLSNFFQKIFKNVKYRYRIFEKSEKYP